MDCYAYCTANAYLIKPLFEHFRSRYKTSLFREALHVEITDNQHIFFFPYGACVFWGLTTERIAEILNEIEPFESGKLDEIEIDVFNYTYGPAKVVEDEIFLPDNEDRTKL